MKFGELEDIRRRFERKSLDSINKIQGVSVSNLSGFSDFILETSSPLLCVCGSTGIGKSTLMHLLNQTIGEEDQNIFGPGIGRFAGANAEISRDFQGAPQTLRFGTINGLETIAHDFIDVDRRTTLPQNFFRQADFEAVLQGFDPLAFDTKLLKLASFVANRSYDEILVREIEADGDTIIPLFTTKAGALEYDSRTCSLGELSIFYLIWSLNIFQDKSIIFIEEPEAFLPPIAQKTLLFILWTSIIRRDHCIILSTHSPQIIAEMPKESLLPLRKIGQTSRVLKDPQAKNRVLSKLGLKSSTKYILYVEDELAKLICGEILSKHGLDKFCEFQIVIHKDSSGGIKNFISGLDRSIEGVHFSGVLDGDMRREAQTWKMQDKFEFLPFANSMEEAFIDNISESVEKFSELVGRDGDRIVDSLDDSDGNDPHTKFLKLAEDLGLSSQNLGLAAYSLWSSKSQNAIATTKFVQSLRVRFELT